MSTRHDTHAAPRVNQQGHEKTNPEESPESAWDERWTLAEPRKMTLDEWQKALDEQAKREGGAK